MDVGVGDAVVVAEPAVPNVRQPVPLAAALQPQPVEVVVAIGIRIAVGTSMTVGTRITVGTSMTVGTSITIGTGITVGTTITVGTGIRGTERIVGPAGPVTAALMPDPQQMVTHRRPPGHPLARLIERQAEREDRAAPDLRRCRERARVGEQVQRAEIVVVAPHSPRRTGRCACAHRQFVVGRQAVVSWQRAPGSG